MKLYDYRNSKKTYDCTGNRCVQMNGIMGRYTDIDSCLSSCKPYVLSGEYTANCPDIPNTSPCTKSANSKITAAWINAANGCSAFVKKDTPFKCLDHVYLASYNPWPWMQDPVNCTSTFSIDHSRDTIKEIVNICKTRNLILRFLFLSEDQHLTQKSGARWIMPNYTPPPKPSVCPLYSTPYYADNPSPLVNYIKSFNDIYNDGKSDKGFNFAFCPESDPNCTNHVCRMDLIQERKFCFCI